MHPDTRRAMREHLLTFIDTRTTDYADEPMWIDAARYHDPDHLRAEYDAVFTAHPRIVAHGGQDLVHTPEGITVTRSDGVLTAVDAAGVHYPVQEYAGLVWMHPDPEASFDMATWFGPELDRDIACCGVADAALYRHETFRLDVNWKTVMDGFTDAYHLQFVHPQTVGPFFHTNVYKCDPFGKNWRMVVARRGIEDFRGEDVDYGEFTEYAIASFTCYPGSIIALAPAHFEIWSVRPDPGDLGRSIVDLWFLVPELPTTDKALRFRAKNWEIVLHAVRDEDWVVAKSVSDSLPRSGIPALVLGRNEKATQILHRSLTADVPWSRS
ncbi:SRPBCC family protein [Pseudonocardia xishanensis]|uniref:Aromatic-ring-hydroxylating dioxygenase alpha subunit C-terminal domain-containing protein n=1 Tax=Pseudonocardia xishanensis TaxID=630995 RepID=A0ABP8RUN2_9PSEU